MRLNINLDDHLTHEAMRVTGLKTKKAVVEAGLKMLIRVKGQAGVQRLRGKVKWEGDLDAMRRDK